MLVEQLLEEVMLCIKLLHNTAGLVRVATEEGVSNHHIIKIYWEAISEEGAVTWKQEN